MDPVFACHINQKYEQSEITASNECVTTFQNDQTNTNQQIIWNSDSTSVEDLNNNNQVFNQGKPLKSDNFYDSPFESIDGKPLVVQIKDVCFSYNKKEKLLNNLNINIQTGHIYGLLGPSECGKSTTLKIILGLLRPRNGDVRVFGCKPNTRNSPVPGPAAGYMPQELSLVPNLSIGDHFNYYGILNGMTFREIGKRSSHLHDLLQIPSMEKPIEKLSGGQQRRASLAIALLHSPSLLILDEPTVGIDPMLRNKIWDYLIELAVTESKTIILTTHYIEEARNAHMIGLMRNGQLLAECNPNKLLELYQMTTIEDVFLNLCEKEDNIVALEADQKISTDENTVDKNCNQIPTKVADSPMTVYAKYTSKKKNSYNYVFEPIRWRAITTDTFTFMCINFWTIFFACLLPTIQVFLFHFAIGKSPSNIAISFSSPETRANKFSDVLMNSFDSSVVVNKYPTTLESIQSVKNGLSYASFEFKPNFTQCLINRARKGSSASNYDIDCSRIRMVSDHTYQFIMFKLVLDMKNAFIDAIYKFFPDLGYNPESLNIPIKVEEFVFGSDKFSYQEFMTPGMYMALIYLAPMIVAIFLLLQHKAYGHIERSRACGVKVLEIISSHFFTNSILVIIQVTFMLSTSLHYFEAQYQGSLSLLVAIVFLQGMAGTASAILMASLIQEKVVAMVAIYGLTISLWFICGIFWPVENITLLFLQKIVYFLPLTLPTETARNIMNRGWDWDHIGVMLGFGSAFAYCAIPLILAFILFR